MKRKRLGSALPAVLLLPVLLVHGCVGLGVQSLHETWIQDEVEPPRMTVSYIRELKPVPALVAVSKPSQPKPLPSLPAQPSPANPGSVTQQALAEPPPAEPATRETLAQTTPEPAPVPASAPETETPAPQDLSSIEPSPEWPPSTRLSYELTGNYRGAVTGQAQVEWIRKGSHYQVHLDVGVGPSFAPLLQRRMSSDGFLDGRGIAPMRYDEETKFIFGERRRVSVIFRGESLVLADGREEPAAVGSQDAASQFVQLTWLFLTGREQMRPGLVVELPLALPRRQYRWRYEVMGEELLQTPMGPLATWHLRPSAVASGGDLTAEVWLAPSLQYLPVRIRIRQDEKNFVDLMLKDAPLQAAPEP